MSVTNEGLRLLEKSDEKKSEKHNTLSLAHDQMQTTVNMEAATLTQKMQELEIEVSMKDTISAVGDGNGLVYNKRQERDNKVPYQASTVMKQSQRSRR